MAARFRKSSTARVTALVFVISDLIYELPARLCDFLNITDGRGQVRSAGEGRLVHVLIALMSAARAKVMGRYLE